jgi:hypothetical protein
MNRSERSAYLTQLAQAAETDSARLKALELLAELDRERPEPPKRPDSSPEALADDTDWLAKTADLFLELGLADGAIEERAQEIAAVRLRERFAVLDPQGPQDAPQGEERTRGPSEPPEAVSEALSGPELHPLDEVAVRLAVDDSAPRPSLLSRRRQLPDVS